MLFVPSVSVGNGIGHLSRCLALLEDFPAGALLVEPAEGRERVERVARSLGHQLPEGTLVSADEYGGGWQLVVLDRRSTSGDELCRYSVHGPVVAVDEGGEARALAPYLIDTFPLPAGSGRANVSSTAFLPRPKRRRGPSDSLSGKVLVTFGGEDRSALSSQIARHLVDDGHFAAEQITVIRGPLFRSQAYPPDIEILDAPPGLRERIHQFDFVFTSFGITAYEAANAGVSVILFNPSPYHRRLARIAGFPEIGVRRVNRPALRRLLSHPDEVRTATARVVGGEERSLAAHLSALDFSRSGGCPACGAVRRSSIARFHDRSFFRCEACSMVYQLDFSRKTHPYGESYFFEDYRRQYGKTYLEDFENIRRFGSARLDRLSALGVDLEGKRLLDVGCAFGAFLVEAAGRGALVFGVDVSDAAVDYVGKSLSIACARSSIEELDLLEAFGVRAVDVVTMWYVIEHLRDLRNVLDKINRMLPIGGTFAFATPNLAGISGRTGLQRFLENSPYDHYTLWDPRIARRVLARHGFRVRETHITGHHPERFRIAGSNQGWKYRVLRRFSEAARLGDTFECFAEKVSEHTR